VTQLLPHFVVPPTQFRLHLPAEQTVPLMHPTPQPPQLLESLVTFTHDEAQSVVPPRQVTLHLPAEQS
jgi:hypothetical protein